MKLRTPPPRPLPAVAGVRGGGPVRAQQLIGYVSTRDAETSGATDVVDGRRADRLGKRHGRDHTAPITLGRGGTVRVCQTAALHLTESRTAAVACAAAVLARPRRRRDPDEGTPNDPS